MKYQRRDIKEKNSFSLLRYDKHQGTSFLQLYDTDLSITPVWSNGAKLILLVTCKIQYKNVFRLVVRFFISFASKLQKVLQKALQIYVASVKFKFTKFEIIKKSAHF